MHLDKTLADYQREIQRHVSSGHATGSIVNSFPNCGAPLGLAVPVMCNLCHTPVLFIPFAAPSAGKPTGHRAVHHRGTAGAQRDPRIDSVGN